MKKLSDLLMISFLGLASSGAVAYPYNYCEQNGKGIKLPDENIQFAINEAQFSSYEIDRLKLAVQSWSKTRLGETSLNVNPDVSAVAEVELAHQTCVDLVSFVTGAPPTSFAYLFSLDLCLEPAMLALTNYSVIHRTGISNESIDTSGDSGWVYTIVQAPPNFPAALDPTEECTISNEWQGIGVGQPYYEQGRNVQLIRPLVPNPSPTGLDLGHTVAPIGSVEKIDDYSFPNSTDINLVTTHEIGHILGLVHPSGGSRTPSVMRGGYSSLANYQYDFHNKFNRVGLPEPIDAKLIHNLYPATSPTLRAGSSNQWEWNTTNLPWIVRPQSAFTSTTGSLPSNEIDGAPYSTPYAVLSCQFSFTTKEPLMNGWQAMYVL